MAFKAQSIDDLLADDIETHLQEQEQRQQEGRSSFIPEESPYFHCRQALVALIIRVCERFGLADSTAFVAVGLMDRMFADQVNINRMDRRPFFVLLALVSISIAGKFGEADERVPSIDQFVEFAEEFRSATKASSDQMAETTAALFGKTELYCLDRILQWRVSTVTPLDFIDRLAARLCTKFADTAGTTQPLIDAILYHVHLILGIALQHLEFVSWLPSHLAASAMLVAMRGHGLFTEIDSANGLGPADAELAKLFGASASWPVLNGCVVKLEARLAEFRQRAASLSVSSRPHPVRSPMAELEEEEDPEEEFREEVSQSSGSSPIEGIDNGFNGFEEDALSPCHG